MIDKKKKRVLLEWSCKARLLASYVKENTIQELNNDPQRNRIVKPSPVIRKGENQRRFKKKKTPQIYRCSVGERERHKQPNSQETKEKRKKKKEVQQQRNNSVRLHRRKKKKNG